MGFLDSLKDKASKAWDQVNMLDSGRSWKTRTPSYEASQESGFNQWKRQSLAGGKAIVKPPAQMLNTIGAQVPQVFYTVQGAFATKELDTATKAMNEATKTGNQDLINAAKLRWDNAKNRVDDINRLQDASNTQFNDQQGGLFNTGTFYNEENAKKGDAEGVKKVVGGTLQTMATVAPFAKGGSVAVGLGKGSLLRAAPKLALEGAAYGATFSTGQQLQDTGSVDPKQLARDTVLGSALNTATPFVTRGISNTGKAAINEFKRTPTTAAVGAVGKNAVNNADNVIVQAEQNAVKKTVGQLDETARAATKKALVTDPNMAQAGNLQREITKREAFLKANANNTSKAMTASKKAVKAEISSMRKEIVALTDSATAAGGKQKLSRFANKTVQNSDEVSAPLKKMVKEEKVAYTPTTNQGRLDNADKWLKGKSNEKAYTEVVKRFENSKAVNDQDIVNAIALAKKLDASGKEADLFKATEIYDNLSRHLTAKGQEVQAASLLNNRTPQGLQYGAQKVLRKNGIEVTPQIQKEIKALVETVKKQAPGSYEDGLARYKLMEYVSNKVPSGVADKAINIWKAGLLTAPTTTGGNLAANTAEQVYKRLYNDPVSAAVDKVFSLFTGTRSKSLTYRGIGSGIKEGAIKGVKYFKTGYDPRNPLTKFDIKDIHYSDTPLGKAAETYTQSVFKLMGSQDQPFYYASLRNSLADQAVTAAKNAGLKGKSRDEFIKKFITQPSKKALQLADDEARYDVFQNKTALGNIATGVKDKSGALGEFVVPFSQVPSSIATRMIDRTPIGLGKEIVKQIRAGRFDQRAMSRAVADASAGIMFMGAGAGLAKEGMITLGYPQDQKERDLWELEGKQPNSVKIGNTWVSLNYFQPMGTLLAAGANYQQALDNGSSKTDAFAAAAGGAGKALTEQSFLKGVSGTLNALTDPQRSAEKFAENTAGSLVPNIIRSFARSSDPVNREQDGLGESVMAGIPGLRQQLPVRTNIYGDPVNRKTDFANSFLNPLRPSDIPQATELNTELRRLFNEDEGITATKIMKDALGKDAPELNRDQQLELKNMVGQQLKTAWEGIVSDQRYSSLSDEDKKKRLEEVKDDITGAIKAEYGFKNNLVTPDPKKLDKGEKAVLMGRMPDYLAKTGGSGSDSIMINNGISDNSKRVLQDYSFMDEPQRNEYFNSRNEAEYEYKLAKYENDSANGTLSKAENAKAQVDLAKEKVGAGYTKETRDLYSLSKQVLFPLLQSDPNGAAMAEQILRLGDALEASGLGDNKFRDKYGNVDFDPSSGGSGGRGGRGGSKKKTLDDQTSLAISTTGALNKKVSSAKVSKPGFSSKVSGRSLQSYRKPTSNSVRVTKKQLTRSKTA